MIFKLDLNNFTNDKNIEVIMTDSGIGALKNSLLNANKKIFISNYQPLGYFITDEFPYELFASASHVRIWTSHKDAYTYINMLWILEHIKSNVSIIFVDDLHEDIKDVGIMYSSEIEKALEYEKKITEEDLKNFHNEWLMVKSSQKDMFVMENNTLTAVNYDYFDEAILNSLNEECEFNKLSIDMIVNDSNNNFDVFTYRFLIARLIRQRKIEFVDFNQTKRCKNIIRRVK